MTEVFHAVPKEEKSAEPRNIELFIAVPAAFLILSLAVLSAGDTISTDWNAFKKMIESIEKPDGLLRTSDLKGR